MPKKLPQSEVLRYSPGRKPQATIRRHYIDWRQQQEPPIPIRCDNPECMFYFEDLMWNGEPLNLVLDHINGVNGDNSPKNLQFLCPNCNSQQSTHGGGNRERVDQHSGGFSTKDKQGKKHYVMPLEPIKASVKLDDLTMTIKKT